MTEVHENDFRQWSMLRQEGPLKNSRRNLLMVRHSGILIEAMRKRVMEPISNKRVASRKRYGRLAWVHEHLQITGLTTILNRVPFPEKGEHVGRHGRKATGQGWSLIAGLLKEGRDKGRRLCQDFRAY